MSEQSQTGTQSVESLLKKAYSDEIETIMNYLTNGVVLKGVRAQEIKEELDGDIDEELAHARMLGDRLDQLGERPPASMDFQGRQQSLQPPEDPTDVPAVIDGVIDAENDAIETYRALIEAAREADDPVTEDIAVEILRDEEAHLNEFRGFRKEYGS